MSSTVAVDFDKVIHTYEHGWADGSIYGDLMPGAFVGLLTLMDHYAVYVHTTRSPRQVARWIERISGYNIDATPEWRPRRFWNTRGLLLVTRRKLPAIAYIDDRAVRFTDWDSALGYVDGERP